MRSSLCPNSITLDDFRTTLSRYDGAVPADAEPLQDQRWKIIPDTVATRRKNGDVYLEKSEILTLADWRIKHAYFPRPNPNDDIADSPGLGNNSPPATPDTRVADLIASNTDDALRAATKTLFSTYEADRSAPGKAIADLVVRSPVNGFGALTASLVLSVYDPENIAFFSDECYRWMLWRNKERSRWDRKIDYEIRAWKNMHAKVQALRQRLGEENVPAADIEKVAYVLAKEDDGRHDDEEAEEGGPRRKRRKKLGPLDPTESELEDFANRADSICLKKGPRGSPRSPTFDDLGYEQDYHLVARCQGPPRRLSKKAEKRLEEKMEEDKLKAEIVGWEERTGCESSIWDDRVARDLGKPYHTVTVRDYEEWKKRGFTMDESIWDYDKQDKEERDRMSEIECGCAFRKGYVG